MTWPLVLNLGDRFPGENSVDAWGHYWNMWWFRQVLLTGANPFTTDLWFAPDGTNLFLHTLAPFNSLLGLIPTLVAGPLVAYNLVAMAAIACSAQGMFLLARHVTGHTGAAIVAGLAFGGSPYLMGHLTVGHLNVAALVSLPVFALALLLAGEGRMWALPLAGVALLFSALSEWHTTLYALVIGGLLITWQAARARRSAVAWRGVGRMVAGMAIGLMLIAPFALATAWAVRAAGDVAELGDRWATQHSANLLAYLIPQDQHPLWGDAVLRWRKTAITEVLSEDRVSLGWIVVALAITGAIAMRWRAAPWLVIAGLGVALALGPEIHIGTTTLQVPTPYDFFDELPLMNVSRTPARFSVLATLALTVLLAAGVAWLAHHLPPRRTWLIVPVVATLVLAEFATAPFHLEKPPDTALARQIGRQIAESDPLGTVLTLPYRRAEQERVFHQVHHERPIFGGFIPRDAEHPFRLNTPGFAELGTLRPFRDIFEPEPDPLAVLNYFHVRYVLLYRGEMQDDASIRALMATMRQVLHQPKAALTSDDGALEAWDVPPAEVTQPFMRTDRGWWAVETFGQLGRARWMRGQGRLYVERPVATPVTIQFTALSYHEPRRVEIRSDDTVLDVITVVPEPTNYVVRLPSGKGSTQITVTSLDGVDRPIDVGAVNDARELSIALSRVRIQGE